MYGGGRIRFVGIGDTDQREALNEKVKRVNTSRNTKDD